MTRSFGHTIRRRSARRILVYGLALPALLLIGVVVAWSLDGGQNGRVARNVTLAGSPVSGMTEAELRATVAQVAAEYSQAAVLVDAPQGGFVTDAQALGLGVQVEPTVAGTLELERTGSAPGRVWGWLKSFFIPRVAPIRLEADRNAVYRVVRAQDSGPRTDPVEPGIRLVDGGLEPVEGKPGTGIDPASVIEALPEAARHGLPLRVEVDRGEVAPRFTLEDAADLARSGERLVLSGLQVKAGDQEAGIPAPELRSWLRSEVTESGLTLGVDPEVATATLRKILNNPNPVPKNATYDVVDGQVVIVPGVPGLGCCADEAGEIAGSALLTPGEQPADLPVVDIPPQVSAQDLSLSGIAEQVSTFTTNHAAGQPRVSNIQLMADLIRGQIIEPGETFSINEFVGPRTREKGFVVDAVIQDGMFDESVGGGVSQFATTIFNAGFFAGLEFPEYQSHSLYISRYPYGREATLSHPRPDLKIHNPSPYPILIWPTYTRSSITVSLYSTKWAEVEQTGQTESSRGPCKLVRTERTITYLADNTTKVDRVNALYRPAEGVNCV